MKKIAYVCLLCLVMVGGAACSSKEDNPPEAKKAKTVEVSKESITTESTVKKFDAATIEVKPTTPVFSDLITNFLEKGLPVSYEGQVGAIEYTDENKDVATLGSSGSQMFFTPSEDNTETAIIISKFETEELFQNYLSQLPGKSDGDMTLNVSEQFGINEKEKMIMTVTQSIDDELFQKYKTVFESK